MGSQGQQGALKASNLVTEFQILQIGPSSKFEAKGIEPMEIGNLLTKIEEGSSSVLAVLATI